MPGDGSYQTAEGSSRKRLKTNSRDAGRPAGNPSKSPEVVSLLSSTPAKPQLAAATEPSQPEGGHTKSAPCAHEQSLSTLHGDLDAMRQLITCKICQRFLYEPYALTCGHTFCYSCLSQWMVQNHKKTCPDCRTKIKEQPAPSYLIRELVLVFTSKSELLPDGETSEEHSQIAKEEADIVAKDKSNTDSRSGGLFKGCFTAGGPRLPLVAIRDDSDHVDRCPQCLHEVERGRCNHCHVRVRTEEDDESLEWSDEDDTDEELDQEFLDDLARDAENDLAYEGYSDFEGLGPYGDDHWVPGFHPNLGAANFPFSDGDDDDEEDEDEEDEHDLQGFIAEDDEPLRHYHDSLDGLSDSEEGTEAAAPHRRQRRQAPIVVSDEEEDEDDDEEPQLHSRHVEHRSLDSRPSRGLPVGRGHDSESEDDDDDDDDEPIRPSQRNVNRRDRTTARIARRPVTVVSDPSDDEDSDSDSEGEGEIRPVGGGFSPLQFTEHDGEEHSEGEGYSGFNGGHEDDDQSETYRTEPDQVGYDDGYGYGAEDDEDGMSDASDEQSIHTSRGRPRPNSFRRLPTLSLRRNRFADPPSRPSNYSLLFPNAPQFGASHHGPTRRVAEQPAARTFRSPAAAYRPVRPTPTHPFTLDNTLASIGRNRSRYSPRRLGSRRTDSASAVSSQSSTGGVDVASTSGSSGSSRTIRADDDNLNVSRRRRFFELESESD